jgi:ABC-type Fe3+-hydroxamate transport system substrate-binding protein
VKRRPSIRAVFQGLPNILIEGRSTFNFTMQTFTAGKYWPVNVFVDGIATTTEAIQSYRPDQIIAVEWYPRGAQAPIQYQSMSHPDSGVMLVWTRFIR